jgi:hypothetical protein
MTWLKPDQMDQVHRIRQDYAAALQQVEDNPSPENHLVLGEVIDRRTRAMRMLEQETEVTPRQLAAMFRCSKQVVRQALM